MAEAGGEGASLLRQQVTFSGESSCAAFQFHRLMPHLCTDCNKDISKHASAAVGDEDVRRALDSIPSRLKLPSEILAATSTGPTTGGLFLGGYHAVDKVQLDKHGIAHVVSCAVGLEVFGPRFASNVSAAKAGGCEFETLPWVDKPEQVIGRDELERALRFIHAARGCGSSVLVHCARGKSRSTTLVVAYLLATGAAGDVASAVAMVQEKRPIAEPNAGFESQLKALQREGFFTSLSL